MQSRAESVEQYLAELPDDRREAIEKVRKVILDNLPDGYVEVMNWGMITYEVPLEIYPDTYNKKPLMYAALAAQKNHLAVYMTGIYIDEEVRQRFETEYKSTGKRFDAGKSCIRFRKPDDLPLEIIGKYIAMFAVGEFIEQSKKIRAGRK